MNTKTFTTVPAQPGFFVLNPVYYENRVTNLSQEPVVAWVIEALVEQDGTVRSDATPVVYGGGLVGLPAVLQPDGQVVLPYMGTFDSAGKYLLYLREEVGEFNGRKACGDGS